MSQAIYMTAEENVAARPFTDPAHIPHYQQTMKYMAQQVCLLLEHPHLSSRPPHIICFNRSENKNWFHRIIIAQPEELQQKQPLTIVGFFGNKRADANMNMAHEFDHTLVDEIPDHPGLYSYSTMALENGNYGNLVIFSNDMARVNWSTSNAHAQAVKELSPNFYHNVTIFNGQMPNGIHHFQDLTLIKAKYYDYQCQPQWMAIRKMAGRELSLES